MSTREDLGCDAIRDEMTGEVIPVDMMSESELRRAIHGPTERQPLLMRENSLLNERLRIWRLIDRPYSDFDTLTGDLEELRAELAEVRSRLTEVRSRLADESRG